MPKRRYKVPYKPKRSCAYSGCDRLTNNGEQYCSEHKMLTDKQYNKYQRGPDHNKRYGRAWKRIRDRYIYLHPLCEECQKEGRINPAKEVHHILPIKKGGTHSRDNLMSLCQSCHNKIHIELGDRCVGKSGNLY